MQPAMQPGEPILAAGGDGAKSTGQAGPTPAGASGIATAGVSGGSPVTPAADPLGKPVAKPVMIELYGQKWPKGTPRIAVEFACYRENLTKARGGLGREEHFRRAWKLMWPKYEWSEWVDVLIHAWCNYKWIVVIGHERASKTYTLAHCAVLDYCCDPTNTLTSLATVTFEGLKFRMWGDLQRAVETVEGYPIHELMTMRSSTNELRMFPREFKAEAAEKMQIHGMAVNQNKDAEGRIRGGHAPRRRIFLDEAQNIADPIFAAVINPMSAPDAKCVMLTNPVERVSKFGEWCEPSGGWASVTENDRSWTLKKFANSICVHLDGLQSPNIKANAAKFTGLLTNENIEEIKRAHGVDSVQWWSLVRGWFPPDGMVSRVFPSMVINKGKPSIIFEFRPEQCASLDPAFEHDNCVLHLAQLGRPVFGVKKYAINCTESMTLKLTVSPGSEPKDYQIAHQVMRECWARGIQPQHFVMDGTGGGRGVAAILQKEWSTDIQVVYYGGASTDRPLRGDNPMKCSELYRWFVSELWFRASECVKDGLIGGIENLDTRTEEDLYARRYEMVQGAKGQLQMVETKAEMKKRIGRSPDHGDAFVQFGELLVRLGTFVGQPAPGAPSSPSSKWEKHRQRAISATIRTREAKEFSYT